MTKRLKKLLKSKNFKYRDDLPSGCSGIYFYVGHGVGIKIYTCDGKKTPLKATRTDTWRWASTSLRNLKAAQKSGFTPKPYGMLTVKYEGLWHAAVVMQHIEGCPPDNDRYYRTIRNLGSKLAKFGIHASDVGTHNAIRSKRGKIYLVDADCWTRF